MAQRPGSRRWSETETHLAARPDALAQSHAPAGVTKPARTRWWILILISTMYLICYMDRSNISVAQPEIAKQFHLTKSAMGLVLAAFAWAYTLGQVPAGWLGDQFPQKKCSRRRLDIAIWRSILVGHWRGPVHPGGKSRYVALVCPFGTGTNPGRHALFQPLCRCRYAIRRRQYLDRIRMARNLLYFRLARRCLGRHLQLLFKNRPEDHQHVNSAELAEIRADSAKSIYPGA